MKSTNHSGGPSLKANFIYNFLYQFLILILPFITLPYISRLFGSERVGIYTYTHAFAEYFYLFGMLGISNHGNRSIAAVRDDVNKLSETFWELFVLKLFPAIVASVGYIVYCLFWCTEHKQIYLLQAFYVFTTIFIIGWFFVGIENFKLFTIRNTIVHVLSTIAVFVFVRTDKDLWIYTLILALMPFVSALSVWPYALHIIKPVKITTEGVLRHVRPMLILFVPIIATSIFNVMDKLMLGSIINKQEVGFYEYACRIVVVPSVIITAMNNVFMPRMSHLFATNKEDTARKLLDETVLMTTLLSCPMAFGLIAVGGDFAVWFYGEDFARTGLFITLLSPVILFKGLSDVIRMQYIIPAQRDNIYVLSLSIGAVINFTLNLLLIPRLQGSGAIIGTLIAEAAVMIFQFLLCRKAFDYKKYFSDAFLLSLFGLLMLILLWRIPLPSMSSFIGILARTVVGILIYTVSAALFLVIKYPTSQLTQELLRRFHVRKQS